MVMTTRLLLNKAIEIVDLPIDSMVTYPCQDAKAPSNAFTATSRGNFPSFDRPGPRSTDQF